jgi:uncharacterized protein YjbI with pentapeptide repeats
MKSIDDLSKAKETFINKIEKYRSSTVDNDNDKEKGILILEKDVLIITKDEASARNAIYTSLIPVVGGTLFWITAYMTWRNLISSEEKQITERFSKATDQLGSDKLPTVMGAIYSLERISRDSEKDYPTTMKILIEFIRDNNSIDNNQNQLVKISQAAQEIINIIGKRRISNPNRDIDEYLDLSYVNLAKISIMNLDLSKIDFRGSHFKNGIISGGKFVNSNLSDCDFSYVNKEFNGTHERNEFAKADLRGAIFHKAVLVKSDFSNARMGEANLTNAQLSNSNMSGANLVGANMSEADLTSADLSDVNLSGATLNNTIISGADLRTAKGLNVSQIKKAKDYKDAKYSSEFKAKLSI